MVDQEQRCTHGIVKECVHTVGYNLPIKRNKVLTHATAWMNLKNMPCEQDPHPKDCILCDFLYVKCPEKEINRNRKYMIGFLELGVGRGMTAKGHKICFKLAFENLVVVVVVQFCKFTKKITELYTLGESYGKEIIPS